MRSVSGGRQFSLTILKGGAVGMAAFRLREQGAIVPIAVAFANRKVSVSSRLLLKAAVIVTGCALLAACNSTTTTQRAEIDPKYGVPPSPRLIGSGKPIPKGGGRQMVGKPYKIGGRWYKPVEDPDYEAVGTASWYGAAFHGRMTANGEVFDANSFSAAHTTMPLPSYARVTNLKNGRSIIVRVNDRGPFHSNRIIDLSHRAAEVLDFRDDGVAKVKVKYIGPARLDGHDNAFLLASYRDPAAGKLPKATPEEKAPERNILLASKGSQKSSPERSSQRVTPSRSIAPPSSATGALLAYAEANPRPRRPIPSRDGPPPITTSSKPRTAPTPTVAGPAPSTELSSDALPGVSGSEPTAAPAVSEPAIATQPRQAPAEVAPSPAPETNDPMAELVEIASADEGSAQGSADVAPAEMQVAAAQAPEENDPIASRIMAAYATMDTSNQGLDAGAIASAAAKTGTPTAVE